MNVIFQGENGTSRLILKPENARDSAYISLCREGKCVSIDGGKPDVLVIVFEKKGERYECLI